VARWAERLGGPRVDHEEIVQEVFLIVDRKLAEFRGDAKLTTWLFRITTRVVANHRRRARRRGLWARLTRRLEEITPAPATSADDGIANEQAARRFRSVLDGLTERHREVLVMFELEQMSTEEIARVVERPPATVRVWLHRARAEFTRRWEDLRREEEAA
ncbi:MAG TPA: RNA polymerase sigma factor, partial [Polyangia bacterium]|nr:RNA polymerase sigma factor [Polyangia bacterium]